MRFSKVARDPRFIYLILGLAIGIPVLSHAIIDVPISATTRAVYEFIEKLPADSLVAVSLDYSTNTVPELHPQAIVIAQHLFLRPLKVVFVANWPDGQALAEAIIDTVDLAGKRYGEDFVNLGLIPNVATFIGILKNVTAFYTRDVRGNPTAELKLFKQFPALNRTSLVVSFTSGDPGVSRYILYWQAPLNIPVAAGATALAAPSYMPFYQSGQLVGILISIRSAAEYETLINRPGISGAGSAMLALSSSHMFIVAAVIVGNTAFLYRKLVATRR